MQYRLSKEQKQEVCRRYQGGESSIVLASEYGVSSPAIRGILKRRGIEIRPQTLAQRKRELQEDAFDVLTPEACYWVGFLFADGSIAKRESSPEITLRLSEVDALHVEEFRRFLGSTHKIVRVPRNAKGFEGTKTAHQLSIRSNRIVHRLEELGMRGLESEVIPEIAMSADFWRGVVDGDGCIGFLSGKRSKEPRIEIVGGRKLLLQFISFIKNSCSQASISAKPHKSIYKVGTSGKTAFCIINTLYSGASIALERKQNAARNILTLGISTLGQRGIYAWGDSASTEPAETTDFASAIAEPRIPRL